MKIPIIKIGNAKGIRLDESILDQYGIKDKVELIFEEEYLILMPIKEVRKDWEEAFRQMNENQDDELLIDDVFEDEQF